MSSAHALDHHDRRERCRATEENQRCRSVAKTSIQPRTLACLEEQPRLSEEAHNPCFHQNETNPRNRNTSNMVIGRKSAAKYNHARRYESQCTLCPLCAGCVRQ